MMRDYDKLISMTDPAYQEYLAGMTNDDLVGDDGVFLYSKDSIAERNENYEIQLYLPGHLAIGADGGGKQFLIELKPESLIWQVGSGALFPDCLEQIASSFVEWKEHDFSLPQEPESESSKHVEVFIAGVPDLKTMFAIKKFLNMPWSGSDMKSMLEKQPVLVVEKIVAFVFEGRLQKAPELKQYFSISPLP